mmetsp:Transcript_27624/g.50147  ORF Transcript_27624/g.50147 Transcript_27624/m.50147 type:complete len:116 (-) Transcript_27624:306-653(-)
MELAISRAQRLEVILDSDVSSSGDDNVDDTGWDDLRKKAVSMGPGQGRSMRRPQSPHSLRSEEKKPMTANLLAAYDAESGTAIFPAIDEVTTICPRRCLCHESCFMRPSANRTGP